MATPMSGTGTVWATSPMNAPRVTTASTSSSDEHLGHQAGVGLPAQVGLVAGDHDEVPLLLGQFDGVEAGGRPGEPAGAALFDLHEGAVHLEVVELLGLDDHEGLELELAEEVGEPPRGGVAGVVPALPGEQGPGTAQGGSAEAADRVHGRAG